MYKVHLGILYFTIFFGKYTAQIPHKKKKGVGGFDDWRSLLSFSTNTFIQTKNQELVSKYPK